ncbi:glycoside hydrolase family 32 protein [Streptococcus hyointestinalis]|uniref:Fructan hydrolase FruB n=1 Tax=Streptococcus hyointestinalis TaxID=1337 RepID=A0A380KFI7_9STRE|nr:glycoside hydrolase family 32 protein [Streptococcus hyointestinalis]SUN63047.1 fructan hydrolase FruB [Streptococcus hyointestinalis]
MKTKKLIITGLAATALLGGIVASQAVFNHKVVYADTKAALAPLSHLGVSSGWSNDLQTITWNESRRGYDIYYLRSADGAANVFGSQGQNWEHTFTKDFVTYESQNSAIAANGGHSTEGWKSAWTGGVITSAGNIKGTSKGQKVAYFSGLKKSDDKQNIWAVASTDGGKTYTQVLNGGKPIMTTSNSLNGVDFRDPYVFTWNGKLMMYVAEGDNIGVYTSTDGISWSKADKNGASKIGNGTFFKGRSWDGNAPVECPVLKTMTLPNGQTKQVLFFGAKDASHGETTGTYYIVGHLDSNGLFAEETEVKRLDQGSDYYGANFSGTTDIEQSNKELISMGWVGNWNYTANGVHPDEAANQSPVYTLGAYSLARSLTLDSNLIIKQTIKAEPKKTNHKSYSNLTKDKTANSNNGNRQWIDREDTNGHVYGLYDIPNQSASQAFTLNFSNTKGNYKGRIYIDIWQGNDYVRFNYDPTNGLYNVKQRAGELDKGTNGQVGSSYYYDGLLGNGNGYSANSGLSNWKTAQLKVYTDKTSVEFVFPNGQTYTVARYSNSAKQDFKVFTEDPTNGNQVSIDVWDTSK